MELKKVYRRCEDSWTETPIDQIQRGDHIKIYDPVRQEYDTFSGKEEVVATERPQGLKVTVAAETKTTVIGGITIHH